MCKWLSDIELTGEKVTLKPLEFSDSKDLVQAANDGELWRLWYTSVPSKETIIKYINTALEQKENGRSLPFIVIHNNSNKVIGSTRFCRADFYNKRVEIGYTWYAKQFHGSMINPECKLLLLSYAFEQLSVIAVEFRTHWHNLHSRNALKKMGAKQDGILRNHRIDPDGAYRDTVVFSVIKSEWPTIKKSLRHRLHYHPNT